MSNGLNLHAIEVSQLRNIARHHATTLRMVRTDIKQGRIDEIVDIRLDAAIEMLDRLAKIGRAEPEL